jgi:septal ring factor EnvC (AmiA/AmiB activator)
MAIARFVLPAILSLSMASCSSMPFGGEETFADRLDDISDSYRDGQKDIRKGRDLVEDGRADLQKQRERRQRELAGLSKAEQDVRLTREEITRVSASGGKPETLEELGDRIRKSEKRANEHREEAQDAADDIRDAERKIARGERMIEEGEEKVAEARRRYYDDTGRDIDELASR